MKAGKTQKPNLTLVKLLTSFSLDQVSYKTEQKQGRILNQMLPQSISSQVNTSLPSPPPKVINYYVNIW